MSKPRDTSGIAPSSHICNSPHHDCNTQAAIKHPLACLSQVFIRADQALQLEMGHWRAALLVLADSEPSMCATFLRAAANIAPKPIPSLRVCLCSRVTSSDLHCFLRATILEMLRRAVLRGRVTMSDNAQVSAIYTNLTVKYMMWSTCFPSLSLGFYNSSPHSCIATNCRRILTPPNHSSLHFTCRDNNRIMFIPMCPLSDSLIGLSWSSDDLYTRAPSSDRPLTIF